MSGKKWGSLAVEALLIVVSILLAFYIDAAWSARTDRLEEVDLLGDLRGELLENRALLEQRIGIHTDFAATGAEFLSLPQIAGHADSAEASDLRRIFVARATFQPVGGALSRLTQSGDLRLVSDPELRSLLADWPRRISENAEEEVRATNLVDNHLRPFLVRRGVAVAIVDAQPPGWMIDLPDGPPIPLAVVLDEEGRGLIALRVSIERLIVRENERLIEVIDRIVSEIDRVLAGI
ncbi:MAG: hypothetical protein AMS19_02725 [Gemmatimonas sp. SG8_23]|nr:MAG: hypothetical protein AMS19_02725 [Gemmatimonas sp. SG8_23]